MDVKYINPFIESVSEVFATMLQAGVARGTICLASGKSDPTHIVALIGLSGPARGTVALHLPTKTALALVGRILGQHLVVVDGTVKDGVAEIVNIIAGNAKAKFGASGDMPIELGLPTLISGSHYSVEYPTKASWLQVPFTSDLGAFSLCVTFVLNGTGR
jgi:chemotaxis protein CheX